MHGDFSRVTFDPAKQFSAVLSLQGRVHVEADANEQSAILHHYLRTLATDLLGEARFPAADPGFEITTIPDNGKLEDLGIGLGRCYVDGLLVENRAEAPPTFYAQPDAYFDPEADPFPDRQFLVYLKVWERLVTWVEDPAIRDVALGAGGPDASARAQVVWQVRCVAFKGTPPKTAAAAKKLWKESLKEKLAAQGTGRLRAGDLPSDDDELCALAPDAGYRGPENQLYRVEIHTSGELGAADEDPPTFKWSRDNGSVVFPIDELGGKLVTVSTLGRDDRSQLDVGDWVEIVDDASAVADSPAALRRVEDIDLGERRITLDDAPTGATGTDRALHPFLRRWDQQERPRLELDGGSNALVAVTGTSPPDENNAGDAWIALEDGVEIRFESGTYRSGDYWLIPARVETGHVEWPQDNGVWAALPPHGVHYHYATLASVTAGANPTVTDLRL